MLLSVRLDDLFEVNLLAVWNRAATPRLKIAENLENTKLKLLSFKTFDDTFKPSFDLNFCALFFSLIDGVPRSLSISSKFRFDSSSFALFVLSSSSSSQFEESLLRV